MARCVQVGGTEDIPQGIVAVLSPCAVDVLSHLAIRARAQNVLLASSFDPAEWAAWQVGAGLTFAPPHARCSAQAAAPGKDGGMDVWMD